MGHAGKQRDQRGAYGEHAEIIANGCALDADALREFPIDI